MTLGASLALAVTFLAVWYEGGVDIAFDSANLLVSLGYTVTGTPFNANVGVSKSKDRIIEQLFASGWVSVEK